MKRGNARTIKKYVNENGKHIIRFAVEVRFNGIWHQAIDPKSKKDIVFDLEYDACGRILAALEKRVI